MKLICWWRAVLSAAGLGLLSLSALGQTYQLIDLGAQVGTPSYAQGINNHGQVVGYWTGSGSAHAFLYNSGVVQDLGTLGGTNSYALSINDSGQIVGFGEVDNGFRAFLFQNGVMTNLDGLGDTNSYALGINGSGKIVGYIDALSGSRAFLYDNGAITDLGTLGGTNSYGFGINGTLQVAGASLLADNATLHAFLWNSGVMTNLNGFLPSGSQWQLNEARGINDQGDIVGWGQFQNKEQAFLYHAGSVSGLGILPGASNSYAFGLNNSLQIVGASSTGGGPRACLWQGGTTVDLNYSLSPNSGWILREARGINDGGQIVGWGTTNAEQHAFLLIPITNAYTGALLAGGQTRQANSLSGNSGALSLSAGNSTSLLNGMSPTMGEDGCLQVPFGAVGWWQAEGNADDSVAWNNGSAGGELGFGPGKVGQAFLFDGNTAYVAVSASSSLDVGAGTGFTIEGWIAPTNAHDTICLAEWNDGYGGLGCHWWLSQPTYAYGGGPGCLFANLVDTDGGFHVFTSPGNVVASNRWQHVALAYDQNTGIGTMYTNGVLAASGNLGSFRPQTTYNLYLGMRASGGDPGFYYGAMDEMRLYNRVLSTNELQAIYLAGSAGCCPVPPSFLVQLTNQVVTEGNDALLSAVAIGTHPLSYQWSFDDQVLSGATVTGLALTNVQGTNAGIYSVVVSNAFGITNATAVLDVNPAVCTSPSTNLVGWWRAEGDAKDALGTNNGTVHNTTFAPGRVGQGFVFGGSSNYVAMPASASLDVGAGSGFTIEGWLKPEGDIAANVCLAEWNSGSGGLGCHFWLSQPTQYSGGGPGSLFINLVDSSGGFHVMPTEGNLLNTNSWHHVAVTYSHSSGIATIYHNGAVVASQPLGIFRPQTTYGLYFGDRVSYLSQRGSLGPYRGRMDEMSLYSRALTQAEIQAIYNASFAGKCLDLPVVQITPTSQVVAEGGSATFSASVTGMGPLSYQWNRNGTNIAGATASSYIGSSLSASASGGYTVLVTNPGGTVESTKALLTVVPSAWFIQYFGSGYQSNTNAALSADPNGNGVLNWQEYLMGRNPVATSTVPDTAEVIGLERYTPLH